MKKIYKSKYYEKVKAAVSAKLKARYMSDPAFRTAARERSKKWQTLQNPEELRAKRRAWYQANKKKQNAQAKVNWLVRKNVQRDAIRKLKSDNPCKDCGNFYPAICMDFDHTDATNKTQAVSKFYGRTTLKRIMEEISKCALVCANCHRVRTFSRLSK